MPLADIIQRIIHFLDVGQGPRFFRVVLVVLAILGISLWYDAHNFSNFAAPDAMDSAQLARNISQGRGYTTDFVRPFSVFLVRKWNEASHADAPPGPGTDFALLQKHPDLQNPPAYPLFLAGLMKILPFHYDMEFHKTFWSEGGRFARYQPEFLIGVANQILLLVAVGQIFFIARKLFDLEVAWVSAMLVFGCDAFWQFSLAGLPTLLVIVIFLALTRLLIAYEETNRSPIPAPRKMLWLAITIGAVAGVGALTLYSFGWIIIPVILFIILCGGVSRGQYGLAAFGGLALVLGPWIARNFVVSGTPFGTAGYSIMEGTYEFTGFRLEQALHPDMTLGWFITPYVRKLLPNLNDILQNELPRLGHSWGIILFMAGTLLPFRGLPVRRLRYFLLLGLGVFIIVQALGRTGVSDLAPDLNSEKVLIIFLPLILMFGTVCFFTFLDQFEVPVMLHPLYYRYGLAGAFLVVMSLPFLGNLISGKSSPLAYPPYYPPEIKMSSAWLRENEMAMSDVPWAVAWYGDRQCMWLTRNVGDDFYEINDYIKPVYALYLTTCTLDEKLFTDCVHAPAKSWQNFAFRTLTGGDNSPFPLAQSPGLGIINSGIFLTDRKRWLAPVP